MLPQLEATVSSTKLAQYSTLTQPPDELINSLREFVAYRTVAANSAYIRDCHEAVTFLRKKCNAFGATTSLLTPSEGVNSILLAKFPASKPTPSTRSVLFYGHYDVVDAEHDPSSQNPSWYGDPFMLQPLSTFLYGRGVTDNKGPILAAIYAVADLVQTGQLACNVTFLIEGDEEAGSRGFRQAVQGAHEAIGHVDFVLLSNSYWLDDHIPCLTFGMRGVIHATITVSSNKPDLHSGMDGKSVQHEPLKDLTVLLAHLVGPSGTTVSIPGFDDDVDDLSESEVQSYASITSSLLPGHPEIKNEKSFALSLMQRWRYPNLTVHRIEVPEAKTAVTISGYAKATLSIRIVPSQTAEQITHSLKQYINDEFANLQSSNALNVAVTSQADPWLADVKNELYTALKDAIVEIWDPDVAVHQYRAFKIADEIKRRPATPPRSDSVPVASSPKSPTSGKNPYYPNSASSSTPTRPAHRRVSSLAATGSFPPSALPREPLFIREGGSIPAISFLEHEFNAPAAMFPMGQASDNAHLDNERMRVENLYKGREVLKKVFARL
jgi:di- and tripeptidase